jgi:hypothetical protein
MRHRDVLVLVTFFAFSGCASAPDVTPSVGCQSIAPAANGWSPISAPSNAKELLILGGAHSRTKALWYQGLQGELRACVYKYCKSVGYDFIEQDGKWSGGINALTVCGA